MTGYERDARNQLFQLTYPNGTVAERTYTARGQLSTNKLGSNIEDTRSYDAGGRLVTSALRNGVTETRTYRNVPGGSPDPARDNMLATIAFAHPGGTPTNRKVGDLTFTWDANRNKTAETITGTMSGYSFDTTLGTDPDGYDDEDRLTYFKRSNNGNPQTWNLSLVGDWNSWSNFGTSQNLTHGPTHEVTDVGGSATTTDVRGNVTLLPATVSGSARGLTWDLDNRLVGVDTDSDSVPDVTYEYDALGRRVARIDSLESVVYVHAGQQVIADYLRGVAPLVTPTYRYLWGDYIDELVCRKNVAGVNAYYHRNQQYSTIAVTNLNGEVSSRIAYTATGEMSILTYNGASQPWSTYKTRYTYTGREWDDATRLYHFRARTYEPKLGRFISRDPLGYVDGMNLYRGYLSLSAMDSLGKTIKSDCNLDVIFKRLNIKYNREGSGPFVYKLSANKDATKNESLWSMRKLILARMLKSDSEFSIAAVNVVDERANLNLHVWPSPLK